VILFVRSLLFHVGFLTWAIIANVGLLWVLVLPRKTVVRFITYYFRGNLPIERYLAGITYEVRGLENIPEGPCVIASKHQSTFETLMMHILLGDPAIVLKRELMWIPLWGWYQARSGMIPIDRGAHGKAMLSMVDNAGKAVAEGRKIVVYPQGTRVRPGVRKPYKVGAAAIAQRYDLPVVPLALNTGMFWPRRSFWVYPGKVIFEFLPPLPKGGSVTDMTRKLEEILEPASQRLCEEVTAVRNG